MQLSRNFSLQELIKSDTAIRKGIEIMQEVDCFDLCDILRLHLTTYYEAPFNVHVMNDGTGNFYGCICR